MSAIPELLQRNERHAAGFADGVGSSAPVLSTVIVTCLDPRVDPAHFLGTRLGEVAVIRTIGGRVDDHVIRDIGLYAHLLGPAGAELSVLVVHHTDCASSRLVRPDVAVAAARAVGARDRDIAAIAIADPYDSVREDLAKLAAARALPAMAAVGGGVYDVATGRLDEVPVLGPLARPKGPRTPSTTGGVASSAGPTTPSSPTTTSSS